MTTSSEEDPDPAFEDEDSYDDHDGFMDWEYEEDEWDEFDDALSECGQTPDGGCTMVGTEFCDWDCPFSQELYRNRHGLRDALGRFTTAAKKAESIASEIVGHSQAATNQLEIPWDSISDSREQPAKAGDQRRDQEKNIRQHQA